MSDGANLQISYLDEVGSWCLGSQSDSIVVSSVADLENYWSNHTSPEMLLQGKRWFNYIERLNDNQLK